jgi:short-subunit dehydrogenase
MRFKAETAIITGASSGLGAEMAIQLASSGVRVGLTARREPELKALAESIRQAGGTAFVAPGDAADPASTRAAMTQLAGQLGHVDLLIANAGVALHFTAKKFIAENFDQMVRVNLTGVAYAIEAVLPGMIDRRQGQIVGVSSIASFRSTPGSQGYCATKAGLSNLLEGLRADLRGSGVSVTTVHPGFVRTPMTAGGGLRQPFLMNVEPAAQIILRGIAKGKRRIDFPWQTAALAKSVCYLPDWLYDRIAGPIVNGKPARKWD